MPLFRRLKVALKINKELYNVLVGRQHNRRGFVRVDPGSSYQALENFTGAGATWDSSEIIFLCDSNQYYCENRESLTAVCLLWPGAVVIPLA